MTNVPQWYVWAIGILMPIIVQLLTGKNWKRWQKSRIAFGVAVLAGVGAVWAEGKLDFANILATIGVIFTVSQLLYDQYFKNLFNK